MDVPPYALALVHAGLGDADAAFEWLERAYVARDVHLMFLTVDVSGIAIAVIAGSEISWRAAVSRPLGRELPKDSSTMFSP